MDVRNCKQCGRLFNYIGKSLCPECLKEREDEFTIVKEYIRENPAQGIAEVSEATGVSPHQIREWIREERLVLSAAVAGGGINCEGCGRPITTGRLCQSCKTQMSEDLNRVIIGKHVKSAADNIVSGGSNNKMRYLNKNNLDK